MEEGYANLVHCTNGIAISGKYKGECFNQNTFGFQHDDIYVSERQIRREKFSLELRNDIKAKL